MSVEVEREMLNAIFAARDEEYADFTAKLIPVSYTHLTLPTNSLV